MADLEHKPEPFKPGSYFLKADDLNQMRDMILRQVKGGQSVEAEYFGDRLLLKDPKQETILPGVQNYLTQFVVLQEFDDYLLCAPFIPPDGPTGWTPQVYDSSLGAKSVVVTYVAKPFVLQRTPWDSQTVLVNGVSTSYAYSDVGVRTATPGGSQQITPSYFPGDVITVVKQITGYLDPNYTPIIWMDANTAGRSWGSVTTGVYAVLNFSSGMSIPNAVATPVNNWQVITDPTGTANANGFNFGDSAIYSYNVTIVWDANNKGDRGVQIVYGDPVNQQSSVYGPPSSTSFHPTVQSVTLNAPGDRSVYVNVYQDSTAALNILANLGSVLDFRTYFTATRIG